jgi:excinuclease UvrABC nuclease subunit
MEKVGALFRLRPVQERAHRFNGHAHRTGRPAQALANTFRPIVGLHVVRETDFWRRPLLCQLRNEREPGKLTTKRRL